MATWALPSALSPPSSGPEAPPCPGTAGRSSSTPPAGTDIQCGQHVSHSWYSYSYTFWGHGSTT